MKKQKVVIVTPLLNEENNILPFITEVRKSLTHHKEYFVSFLFIDDGSTDSTWKFLEKIAKKDQFIKAIKLSRNFGSHIAWFAGMKSLTEKKDFDKVVLMTVDLQDPPALIPKLLDRVKHDIRVAWAVRQNRADSRTAQFFSNVYYYLVRRFALPLMPQGGMDFCVVDHTVVEAVIKSAEKNISLLTLILWLGFPQVMLPYERGVRRFGKSHWTLTKKIKLFIDTFVAFSYTPIRFTSYAGFMVSGLGFVYAIVVLVRRLIYGAPIEGWSSLMLVILFLSGAQLITLGIIAEYLWRTLDQTRQRPMYLVDKKINL